MMPLMSKTRLKNENVVRIKCVCYLTSNEADLPGALVLVCGVVRSGGLLAFGS